MKLYRFFFHYRKSTKGMTVHFRNQCIPCVDVKCLVPCETKRNKTQPRLVMQGKCNNIKIDKDVVIIE